MVALSVVCYSNETAINDGNLLTSEPSELLALPSFFLKIGQLAGRRQRAKRPNGRVEDIKQHQHPVLIAVERAVVGFVAVALAV
ncbi:hypothetical protein Poly59_36530 [Rubripirellula reticaptiva]|uniref:Uncharacterized protein n=1 Tax=Rubripirellula reticaptiva TaxID=2528013 RepID=A0A5C6EKN1_9BACT|nr:hypothetical protein Poly59_36530 [Rubripirellula reticaptiva]